jgi:hypothetical protein
LNHIQNTDNQDASDWILEKPWLISTIVGVLACLRLCHSGVLWADEDYHLAAAVHILNGKVPYRDFWYDKPPLAAVFHLLVGGQAGWPLRVLGAAYVVLACYFAYCVARDWWGEKEGRVAAVLLAFFLTFYLPSTVIPLVPDALMIVPHLAAVYYARKNRAMGAGVSTGIAFLVNIKAVFVFATCVVLLWSGIGANLVLLAVGFLIPIFAATGWAVSTGAWAGYREQVWTWGLLYAKSSPASNPWQTGLLRTVHWLGFHAALTVGAIFTFLRIQKRERWQLAAWMALSFLAVCVGARFTGRYYLQLLPAAVVAASHGLVVAIDRFRIRGYAVVAMLLLLPMMRFGPHYLSLAVDEMAGRTPQWGDLAMDLDSRRAAEVIGHLAHPGDTLFVWGYRPNLYVYTRLSPDGRFWDSQPITGVPADRHLSASAAIYSEPAKLNRDELAHSRPAFIVDGLSLLNSRLKPDAYPEIQAWMKNYKLVARTAFCLIYRRVDQ